VSHYVEHLPPAELAPLVDRFWTSTRGAGGASSPTRVLPDGCADVIVDLAGARPPAFVVGPMTRAEVVDDAGAHEFVAVRFRPGGAAIWFDAPLDEWVDAHVDLSDAWRDGARVVEAVAAATATEARVDRLAAELLERAHASRRASVATRAVALARAVRAAAPETSVAALASQLGLTRQHLARTFRATVGIGPKMLQRVDRMQRALALLARRPAPPLAQVALACGYADQPHLTGELVALTGRTPGAWRDDPR
jgi:AraC-like DNA-binding protein